MAQRETVTVAVLFMKPDFVTTPKKDMGGIVRVVKVVPISRVAEHRILLILIPIKRA